MKRTSLLLVAAVALVGAYHVHDRARGGQAGRSLRQEPGVAPVAATPVPHRGGGTSAAAATPGTICGTVTNLSTGAPLGGVTIAARVLDDTGQPYSTTTDASGRFSLAGLPAVRHLVAYHLAAHVPFFQEQEPATDGCWADAVLDPGFQTTVLVTAATPAGARPLAGAQVVLVKGVSPSVPDPRIPPPEMRALVAVTDGEGRAQLPGSARGMYELRVTASGYAGSVDRVMVLPGAILAATLDRAATVSGLVRDGQGRPLADAHVVIAAADERLQNLAGRYREPVVRTDRDGAFRFDDVPAGPHLLLTIAPGGLAHQHALDVDAGASARVVLEVPAAATLRGRVVDVDGHPLAGAQVSISARSYRAFGVVGRPELNTLLRRGAVTGADGSFVLENLATDIPIQVRARHAGLAEWERIFTPGAVPASGINIVLGAPMTPPERS